MSTSLFTYIAVGGVLGGAIVIKFTPLYKRINIVHLHFGIIIGSAMGSLVYASLNIHS